MSQPHSPQVSTFAKVREDKSNKEKPINRDASEILLSFRAENPQIAKIREAYQEAIEWGHDPKEAIKELKPLLPVVTWSGTFTERLTAGLTQHSGLLVADLDDLSKEDMVKSREILTRSPHVWGLFASPSGCGLKVVFRIRADPEHHRGSFRAIESLILRDCRIKTDPSGKDIPRACFFSQDSEAYLNLEATEIEPEAEKPREVRLGSSTPTTETFSDRRKIADSLRPNIQWENDSMGYCECPGIDLHTTPDGVKDCQIKLDSNPPNIPTFYCVHSHCKAEVDVINHELRSKIGKLEWPAKMAALAALDDYDYQQIRKEKAKELGLTPSALDKAVKKGKRQAKAAIRWDDPEKDDALLVYDSVSMCWWIQNTHRTYYKKVNENGARSLLKSLGFSDESEDGEMSPLQVDMLRRQKDVDAHYIGAIAGYPSGYFASDGQKVLIPHGHSLLQAKDIPCPRLLSLLTNMLGDEQLLRFLCWLKIRRGAVRDNEWTPGQAFVFVGPASCGKSFTQQLITDLLGGRVAKPWRYLSGATEFNGELIGAEHLAVEDEAPNRDLLTRRTIGNKIKNMLFAKGQSAHTKKMTAVTLEPKWALSFSLNGETENLLALPPIDESMRDKITIVKCSYAPRDVPHGTGELEWLKLIIKEELAGLAHFIDTIPVPTQWKDERCGVSAYRHPEIELLLLDQAPESQLLDIIDEVLFSGPLPTSWKGKVSELNSLLRSSNRGLEFCRLDSYRNAIGTYLGRLATLENPRVFHRRIKTHNAWEIYRSGTSNHEEEPAKTARFEVEI